MRPLEGVVVDTSAGLTIRLQSRALVRTPRQKKLKLGDTCYVLYNYTTMQVRMIWTEKEYNALEDSSGDAFEFLLPPEWEEPHAWALDP